MSDNYTDPIEDDDDGDGTEDFKNLRAKARKAAKLEQENVLMRRELAFIKAGVPMDDPKTGYFVKGYDGELDPQAIRQAAIEAGFMAAPQQAPDLEVQAAAAGQAAILAASAGTVPEFDETAIDYRMEQAYAEGGLEGLSAVAEQYGVTFRPELI
jgi:hypothetical protein